jgi:hypothetical protein
MDNSSVHDNRQIIPEFKSSGIGRICQQRSSPLDPQVSGSFKHNYSNLQTKVASLKQSAFCAGGTTAVTDTQRLAAIEWNCSKWTLSAGLSPHEGASLPKPSPDRKAVHNGMLKEICALHVK